MHKNAIICINLRKYAWRCDKKYIRVLFVTAVANALHPQLQYDAIHGTPLPRRQKENIKNGKVARCIYRTYYPNV